MRRAWAWWWVAHAWLAMMAILLIAQTILVIVAFVWLAFWIGSVGWNDLGDLDDAGTVVAALVGSWVCDKAGQVAMDKLHEAWIRSLKATADHLERGEG